MRGDTLAGEPCRRVRGLVVLAALIISLTACGGEADWVPRAGPSPLPAWQQPSGATLTGTVIEFTESGERRPVPNLRLEVRAGGPFDGAVGGTPLPDVVTDADGRYQIAGVTSPTLWIRTPPGSGHKFPCEFYPLMVFVASGGRPDPYLTDLPVVHANWSGDQQPPGMWNIGTSVFGVVSERVGDTVLPVAGATVTLDGGLSDPPGTTNAAGFYLICSVVGSDQFRTVAARKEGYETVAREVFFSWVFRVDLEIARQEGF